MTNYMVTMMSGRDGPTREQVPHVNGTVATHLSPLADVGPVPSDLPVSQQSPKSGFSEISHFVNPGSIFKKYSASQTKPRCSEFAASGLEFGGKAL